MDITRTRGDTYADQFIIENFTAKTVVDLSECTFKMTVNSDREPLDISTQLYQIVGVSDSPATGVVNFSPTVEQADLVGKYYFDIQMIDADGVIRTLTKGMYTYTQDITK